MPEEQNEYWENFSRKFPVMSFSLLHARKKRYTYGLFFSFLIPIFQFLLVLYFTDNDMSNGQTHLLYYRIYFRIVLFFLTSLIALLVGTGMYRDLISDETIVYIMTRPLDRGRVYLEMYGAYIIITFIITLPGIILFHIVGEVSALVYDPVFSLSLGQSLLNLMLELGAACIVLLGLGGVFITTGLWLKRPLLINLLIAFGIIVQAFLIDLISDRFEPIYIAQNIVSKELNGFSSIPEVQNRILRFSLGPEVSAINGFLNFIIILIITLILGYIIALRKEFD